MKRKVVWSFVLVLSLISVRGKCFGDTVPDYYAENARELLECGSFSQFISDIVEGRMPDATGILDKLFGLILPDVRLCLGYTASVLGLCILSSCVKGSQLRLRGSSGDIAYLVCYFMTAGFLLGILKNGVSIAFAATDELGTFVRMALPAYIGIITSYGIAFRPSGAIFLAMVNVVSAYAGNFMINAFLYIGVLTVISNMSEQIRITKLIGIFRQVMFWILGFLLTVFAGLTSLSGIGAVASSGTGMKAVKYAVGRTVPLVGGFLADSAELIMASARIFKGAFGTGGIIFIFAICIVPIAKLFVIGFVLRITAGLAEPFCHNAICDTVYGVGQTVIHIMSALILMTVMFILAFAVLLICGVAV